MHGPDGEHRPGQQEPRDDGDGHEGDGAEGRRVERLGHGPADGAASTSEDLEDEGHVLLDRLVLEETEILEDDTDVASQARDLASRHVAQFATGDVDLAVGGRDLVRHEAHERTLAGTGGADEEDELTARDVEADVLQRRGVVLVVRQGDVVESDHRGVECSRSRR